MTTARRFFVISAFALAIALPSYAYDDSVTHPQLTIVATQKSVLYTDGSIMFNLGLFPADRQQFIYGARTQAGRTGEPFYYGTSGFVGEGAYDEDIGKRALNHFYDPLYDRGLGIPIVCSLFTCEPSWRWMLEPNGDISGQDFSMADARNFLYRGLTFTGGAPADSSNQRGIAMAQMFLSLGHLQHHMQDMTQPQHVRNDVHYDKFTIPGYSTPSRYEKYTAEQSGTIAGYAAGGSPVYPGAPAFNLPRDFWNNSAALGVSQFTNTNFLSYGTNFSFDHGVANANREYTQPLPGAPHPYTVGEIFGTVPPDIQSLCGLDGVDCTMTMYPTAMTPKASTLSIFDQDLLPRGLRVVYAGDFPVGYATERLFALNRFNFDAVHPPLINAAVSYSAGLINYFFRGKLRVTAPAQGPIAVVDHSANTGFTTVKLKVKNDTPNEALSNGTLQAIAKFHRNGCYQADLSGEFTVDSAGNLITPCPNYRSPESHLRLTTATSEAFTAGEEREITFTFSDPIPLDATDLIIQLLYRGQVGNETQSFALGALDVSEPSYVTAMNATDVFELAANGFYYYTDIIQKIADPPYSIVDIDGNHAYNSPPDVNVTGGPINYQFIINNKKVGDVTVPEGRFARVAALVDSGGFTVELIAIGNGIFSDNVYGFGANRLQLDPVSNFFIVTPFHKLRKQVNHFTSVTYWHYYPTTGTPLENMQESKATDATTLVAVQMTPP